MELFEIKDDLVTFAPQALTLKPFKALWSRDKSKGKKVAISELAAVYYYSDYKSDFSEILDPQAKLETIQTVITDLPDKWKPDAKFDEAVEFYKERQQTVTTILYDDSKAAISKISEFLRTVDLTEKDENDKFVHDIKKINDVIGGLPKTVETVSKLEDIVKKEMQVKDTLRGGHAKNTMEDGI